MNNNTKNVKQTSLDESSVSQSKIEYTPEELQFIITTLGEQTFKIKEIEFIYNLLVKLQQDYLKQSKK